MVEGAYDTLNDKSNAHGIVDTKILWNSMGLKIKAAFAYFSCQYYIYIIVRD